MDWKAFIASIVGSVAWPAVIALLLFLLRKQLGGIAERIEEVTFPGGYKAKFVRALEQGRREQEFVADYSAVDRSSLKMDERGLDLANRFPEAAVMEAYKDVEAVLLELRSSLDLPPRSNLRNVVRALVERGLVDAEVRPLFESFQQARNASAHAGNLVRVTPGEALEYMGQAQVLLASFQKILSRLK